MKKNIGFLTFVIKISSKLLSLFLKLIKSSKVIKGVFAVGSFIGYTYLFTWQFAALILVSTFIHEMGHIYAMKKVGLKTKGIYFIPFLGAAAIANNYFKSRHDECYIALMGPLWGFGTAVITVIIYFITKIEFFGAASAWISLVNLFNLLPINPLDGGRVFKSVVMSINGLFGLIMLGITVFICIFIAFNTGLILFGFLALVGLFEFLIERWKMIKVQRKWKETFELYKKAEFTDKEILQIKNIYGYTVAHDITEKIKKFLKSQIDKLEKDLPPVKLTYYQMGKWIILYIMLTAILWILMYYMSHIPGVELAKSLMST